MLFKIIIWFQLIYLGNLSQKSFTTMPRDICMGTEGVRVTVRSKVVKPDPNRSQRQVEMPAGNSQGLSITTFNRGRSAGLHNTHVTSDSRKETTRDKYKTTYRSESRSTTHRRFDNLHRRSSSASYLSTKRNYEIPKCKDMEPSITVYSSKQPDKHHQTAYKNLNEPRGYNRSFDIDDRRARPFSRYNSRGDTYQGQSHINNNYKSYDCYRKSYKYDIQSKHGEHKSARTPHRTRREREESDFDYYLRRLQGDKNVPIYRRFATYRVHDKLDVSDDDLIMGWERLNPQGSRDCYYKSFGNLYHWTFPQIALIGSSHVEHLDKMKNDFEFPQRTRDLLSHCSFLGVGGLCWWKCVNELNGIFKNSYKKEKYGNVWHKFDQSEKSASFFVIILGSNDASDLNCRLADLKEKLGARTFARVAAMETDEWLERFKPFISFHSSNSGKCSGTQLLFQVSQPTIQVAGVIGPEYNYVE